MTVFLDDRPLKLVGPKAARRLPATADFDHVVDARLDLLRPEALHGHLLVANATPATVTRLLKLWNTSDLSQLLSVTLICADKDAVEDELKRPFKIIKAAGGVVLNEQGELLLIYRRGVWDLPKGKLDDGETSRQGAAREVEEETGVKVAVHERIATTWHSYVQNGSRMLKRTKWYRMSVEDAKNLGPQAEEGIERVAWFSPAQARLVLAGSFSSIRYVLDEMGLKSQV